MEKRKHKKNVTDLPGLHGIKTLRSSGKRSIPRGYQGSTFLELYMLAKERDRLEREHLIIEHRQKIIQRRLNEIGRESQQLNEMELSNLFEGGHSIRKSIPTAVGLTKEWHKMALQY